VEGEQAELDAEGDEDDDGDQDRRAGVDRRDALGDGVHLERAGDVVERGDADQEQERAEQVDDREDEPGAELTRLVPVHGEHVGGDHRKLEEDVEVEDVSRQEEAR
jgi:hypothetical protein